LGLVIGFAGNTAWALGPDNTEASDYCKEECADDFLAGNTCKMGCNEFINLGDCVSYFNVDQDMGNHTGDWVEKCKWYNSCDESSDRRCRFLHRFLPEFKNLGQCLQAAEEAF
jgi:hypothetical protein